MMLIFDEKAPQMTKILIPTDFSLNANNAIDYALELFKYQPCIFFFINVYKMEFGNRAALNSPTSKDYELENEKSKSLKGLKEAVKRITASSSATDHSYEIITSLDDLDDAMKSVIKKEQINLVVMGTKGASNYEKKAFGSNAIHTMEYVDECPILSVPLDFKVKDTHEVVLTTDYKLKYHKNQIEQFKQVIHFLQGHLCILHVAEEKELNTSESKNREWLEGQFQGIPHTFHHVTGHDVKEGVRHFIESRDSSMLAFGNRKHSFLSKLFSTNMAMEFGMFSDIPLFVMSGK
ncbi:universal stress protein [Nonlabens spongiae]|nr:universal stress protein [Nonlabens spongiae]